MTINYFDFSKIFRKRKVVQIHLPQLQSPHPPKTILPTFQTYSGYPMAGYPRGVAGRPPQRHQRPIRRPMTSFNQRAILLHLFLTLHLPTLPNRRKVRQAYRQVAPPVCHSKPYPPLVVRRLQLLLPPLTLAMPMVLLVFLVGILHIAQVTQCRGL